MDNDEKTVLQEKFDKVKDLRPIDDVFSRYWQRTPWYVRRFFERFLAMINWS